MDNPYEPSATLASQDTLKKAKSRSPESRFRLVLLASLAIELIGVPVSLISERFLPAPLVAYLDFETEQPMTVTEIVLAVAALVIFIVSIWNFVQLYRFRHSARPIAIVLTVFWVLVMIFLGPNVESGLSGTFWEASALLWGAAMAMMYCTPYDELFAPD